MLCYRVKKRKSYGLSEDFLFYDPHGYEQAARQRELRMDAGMREHVHAEHSVTQ